MTAFVSTVVLTRTADTTSYNANDVLGANVTAGAGGAVLTFESIGPEAGSIMITSASMLINSTGVISGETSYRLYLYKESPASALADNIAWDLPAGDQVHFVGFIDLGTPVDLGSTLYVQTDGINKQIRLAGQKLYGYLVTNGGYAPTSARVYTIRLHSIHV